MSQQFKISMSADPARGALRMSCQNANCEAERKGWVLALDPTDAKHATALRWLHGDQGRRFVELRSEDAADWVSNHGASQGVTDSEGKLAALISRTPPGMLVLLFPPGQPCLKPHVDREVQFAHATPRGLRVHERFEDYREHWDEEADRVNHVVRRG